MTTVAAIDRLVHHAAILEMGPTRGIPQCRYPDDNCNDHNYPAGRM